MRSTALKSAPPPEELSDLEMAQTAISQADGDREKATEILVKMMAGSKLYIEGNFERILRSWASSRISHEVSAMRKSTMATVKSIGIPANRHYAAIKIAAAAENRRLMDEPVFGSLKRLGDCTAQEVHESARLYQANAATYGRKARYHSLVAEAAEKNASGDADQVRSILAEATLAKLWEESNV